MKGRPLGGGVHRAARLAAASIALAAPAVAGCLDRPVAPIQPLTTSTETDVLRQSGVDKIDLLLMIDNSASMADKQDILAAAVPNLINGILNPPCLDGRTGQPVAANLQPGTPTAACPTGSQREFSPVTDVHVGIITSSMGTFGASGCPDSAVNTCPTGSTNTSNNDLGHLITRTDPCDAAAPDVPTYQNEGFLAWDPNKQLTPNGETDITRFTSNLTELVQGTGQEGCGWEQQNEAWYHFLVDPAPLVLVADPNSSKLNVGVENTQTNTLDAFDMQHLANNQFGTYHHVDKDLLNERQKFLRPDSLLAIIVLTDETDVSIKQSSYNPVLAEGDYLPHARAECTDPAKGPGDRCCTSCGLPTPDGCPPNPACASNPQYSSADEDPRHGIRAFGLTNGKESLKARYGIDFLYPTSRYVAALTQTKLKDDAGNTFQNPLLAQRDSSLLYYATITGVPWQLIARQTASGAPDLLNGIDPSDKTPKGGFKTPAELAMKDPLGNTFWEDIVGDPDNYQPPRSPFMQESTVPRTGRDPITGLSIGSQNALNGHEWNIASPANDIEYACTFPIPKPRDCSKDASGACNCYGNTPEQNNPLCQANSSDPTGNPTQQYQAKAYPGVRNLAIVKGMYDNDPTSGGIVASICAKQTDDSSAADYGYKPAVQAIIDRLKQRLSNQCLARPLHPDASGQVQCVVLEATPKGPSGCSCGAAREAVSATDPVVLAAIERDETVSGDCFCEITQTHGAELTSCQESVTEPSGVDGWCYVDATVIPNVGNEQIVAECPSTERRQNPLRGRGPPRRRIRDIHHLRRPVGHLREHAINARSRPRSAPPRRARTTSRPPRWRPRGTGSGRSSPGARGRAIPPARSGGGTCPPAPPRQRDRPSGRRWPRRRAPPPRAAGRR